MKRIDYIDQQNEIGERHTKEENEIIAKMEARHRKEIGPVEKKVCAIEDRIDELKYERDEIIEDQKHKAKYGY